MDKETITKTKKNKSKKHQTAKLNITETRAQITKQIKRKQKIEYKKNTQSLRQKQSNNKRTKKYITVKRQKK